MSEERVYHYIKDATELYEKAYREIKCPMCREDVKMILEASREVAEIAKWAAHTHERELEALRKLGAELDRLRILNLLIGLHKLIKLFRLKAT